MGCLIFWITGIIAAILGVDGVRNYKDYQKPVLGLLMTLFFCICMSWGMVILESIEGNYKPFWWAHNCYENSIVSWEEEYLDKDGNKVGPDDKWTVHHTYRTYTCRKCGKVRREQLQ